ncbi:MAG: signal peptidase I, partial [Eubacterium sp.]|nr:signal peptidase I [Eubacterium sp.]
MMPEEKNSGKEYIASGSISGKTVPAAKKKHLHPAAVFFLKLGIILAAFYLVFHFVFGIYRISGNYMFPKVNDGDLIITYRLGDLHKNDVVMYRTPDGIRAGRVIGLPGTSIDITDQGAVYSDGSQLEEEIFYPTVKADGSDVT